MAENTQGANEVIAFPNLEQTPESEKQKPGYCISVAKAIIDKHRNGRTAISPKWTDFFTELRQYGMGKQSPDKYKKFMSGSSNQNADVLDDPQLDSREAARKGWWNINWDNIVSFIPNLKSLIFGSFNDLDYDIRCDAIDIDSGATEELKMLEVYIGTHPVYGKMINDLKQSANIPIEEPEFVPEDLKELEDIKSEGGFKEPYVQNHEKLIAHTENVSKWDRFLKDELLNDIIDIGYPAAYVEYSDETATPMWQYANPADIVMQYDHDNGFQNSDYAAVRVKMTISELKQYRDFIYDSKGNKISEEGFKAIAKKFSKYESNPDAVEWANFEKQVNYGYAYDSFKVEVWKCWWKDVEYIKRVKYYNQFGKLRMYDYKEPIEQDYDVRQGNNSFDYPYDMGNNYSLKVEPYEGTTIAQSSKRRNGVDVLANNGGKVKVKAYINIGKGEQMQKVRIRKLYYCYWIADTDYCFKFGPMPNQPRYELTEPLLPLVMYRYPLKSIVFRCLAVADMYNIAWYRLQNALSKASQGVYAINTTLLGDNGKKLDPLKVLKAMRENQVLFYKMGLNNVGGTPVPVTYIPGNLLEVINAEIVIMERCIKFVEDLTGFSMIALGSTPNPKQLVGTTEISMQQTQKSLLPIMTALQYIKEELAKRTSAMWQLAIQNDPKARQHAAKIIGEDGVFILQQARSLGSQYGIHSVARADTLMKQTIIQSASDSAAKGQITEDQKLFIIEQVSSGQNVREIRMKLRKMIQKNRQMEEMYKQQAIVAQNKGLQETAAAQAQSAERIKAAEMKAKDSEIRTQSQADIVVRHHDSDMKIREMAAQKQIENGQQPMVQEQPAQPQPPVQNV